MDINKKNRSDLKSYFVKNSIPTESNFSELIDGMLNQKDDGIVKSPGDPLSIEAAGDINGLQKVINFYAKFHDPSPSWSLQLNPHTDRNRPETAKAGFCVADGQNTPRLFIDKTNGNIGVGTTTPSAKLDIAQAVRTGTHPTGIKGLYVTGDFGVADGIEFRNSDATQGIGFGANTIYAAGSNTNQDLNLKAKGTGSVKADGNLHCTALIASQLIQGIGMVPPGGIVMQFCADTSKCYDNTGAGIVGTPYSGWALCNGNNGTPDLRDRFIVGVGTDVNTCTSGNADSHTHTIAPSSQAFYTSSNGSHDHKMPENWYNRGVYDGSRTGLDVRGQPINEARTGSDGSHNHSVTVALNKFESASNNGLNRPKYFALYFIMRLSTP